MAIFLLAWLLVGCADTGYYWQSLRGHVQVLQAARPVADWLDDAGTPAPLKKRLQLAQQLRHFVIIRAIKATRQQDVITNIAVQDIGHVRAVAV